MAFDAIPHSVALLKLMIDHSAELSPLGQATRIDTSTSTFDMPAHKFLLALLTHAISPQTMAKEFVVALGQSGNQAIDALASEVSNESCVMVPEAWAREVYEKIKEFGNLPKVTQFASHYLSHLLIAFRNPGGKKTPQSSVISSPHPGHIEEIDELLREATATDKCRQTALRELVFLRDGYKCPITFERFQPPNAVKPRCAHIIPFSVGPKTHTLAAIDMFTGQMLNSKTVLDNINHPRNALNLETNIHDSMNSDLAWGIEALATDHGCEYYYRVVRADHIPRFARLKDGDEIQFGHGAGNERIVFPDPNFCNIHLAICRVSYACGASEIFDQFWDDEDDDRLQVPMYFGSPFVSDDVLMRKLDVLVS